MRLHTPRRFDADVETALFDEDGLDLDPDSYAGQRAEEEVRNDETLTALSIAEWHADNEQSARYGRDDDEEYREYLTEVRRTIDSGLPEAIQKVALDAITDVEMGGHSVDLRRSTTLDCPQCDEEDVSAYYLGTTMDSVRVTGWVCGHCGETLIEDDNGTIVVDDTPIEDGGDQQ